MTAKDLEVMCKTVTRCSTCHLGLVDIESLPAEKRLNDHSGMIHSHKCRECNTDFVSEIHLQYHPRYSHDTVCTYCDGYCSDWCSKNLVKQCAWMKETK